MNLKNIIQKNWKRRKQVKKALEQLAIVIDTDLTNDLNGTSVYFEDETFDMKPLMFLSPEVIHNYLINNVSFDLSKLYNIHIYKEKVVVERNTVAVGLEYFDKKKLKKMKQWAKGLNKEIKKRGVLRVVDFPYRETRFLDYGDIARYLRKLLTNASDVKATPDCVVVYGTK